MQQQADEKLRLNSEPPPFGADEAYSAASGIGLPLRLGDPEAGWLPDPLPEDLSTCHRLLQSLETERIRLTSSLQAVSEAVSQIVGDSIGMTMTAGKKRGEVEAREEENPSEAEAEAEAEGEAATPTCSSEKVVPTPEDGGMYCIQSVVTGSLLCVHDYDVLRAVAAPRNLSRVNKKFRFVADSLGDGNRWRLRAGRKFWNQACYVRSGESSGYSLGLCQSSPPFFLLKWNPIVQGFLVQQEGTDLVWVFDGEGRDVIVGKLEEEDRKAFYWRFVRVTK